jgi:cobalt-precorrin 5A hydrolase
VKHTHKNRLAVWVITPNGAQLADQLRQNLTGLCVYASSAIQKQFRQFQAFDNLADSIQREFHQYTGHIFIMSTGIVVRQIAGLIRHKTVDPAVIVVDDRGCHAISLLAGHIGGANKLTGQISDIIGARPVITTATDVNRLPAVDLLATEKKLRIENPSAIKHVNMAILEGRSIFLHDPYRYLTDRLPNCEIRAPAEFEQLSLAGATCSTGNETAAVYIDDVTIDLSTRVLVLRPSSLVAGIGCNRNTELAEIRNLLVAASERANLSLASLKCLASIDVKADESGLIALGRDLELPLVFFNRQELNQVNTIQNPSTVVEKHVGVKSVCEAAAILAARNGTLVVPKQTTRNATVAIARISSLSSELAPEAPSI